MLIPLNPSLAQRLSQLTSQLFSSLPLILTPTLSNQSKKKVLRKKSADDLRSALYDIWDDPTLSAYILKNHEHTIGALHSAASKSIRTGRKSNFPDPDSLMPEVATLQKKFDSSRLISWRLQTDAVIFMRTPKNSDYNALERVYRNFHNHRLSMATRTKHFSLFQFTPGFPGVLVMYIVHPSTRCCRLRPFTTS